MPSSFENYWKDSNEINKKENYNNYVLKSLQDTEKEI